MRIDLPCPCCRVASRLDILALNLGLEVDAQLRYQSRIRRMPEVVTGTGIDAYTELDVRVGWRASDQLELAMIGQNLLDDAHAEFGQPERRGEIERSVLLKATWRL